MRLLDVDDYVGVEVEVVIASVVPVTVMHPLEAGERRRILMNDSESALRIKLGAGGTHANYDHVIPEQSGFEVPDDYQGEITGVWDRADGACRVLLGFHGDEDSEWSFVNLALEGLVAGTYTEATSVLVSMKNAEILEGAFRSAEDTPERTVVIYIGPGHFWFYGASRPPHNVRFMTAGWEMTKLLAHPDWPSNGPIILHPVDDLGHNIALDDAIFEDVDMDGRYELNAAFNTKLKNTEALLFVTNGTVGEVDGTGGADMILPTCAFQQITKAIPAGGGRLLADKYEGNNVMYLLYESATGTAAATPGFVTGDVVLHNVTYVNQSNSTPIDVPVDTVFRFYGVTTTEGIRIHGFHRLTMNRVRSRYFGSQGFQAGGHPYNAGSLEKDTALFMHCDFSYSYNSDGFDLKAGARLMFFHCTGTGSHDVAYDVRGPGLVWIGGDLSGSKGGLGISCTQSVNPRPVQGLPSSVTAKQALDVTLAANVRQYAPATFTGWLGQTERISGTYNSATGVAHVDAANRGLEGTFARAWPAYSGSRLSFLQMDVADIHTELTFRADSDIAVVGLTADHCDGNAITISGSGTGTARVHISMCQLNFARAAAIEARGVRGVLEFTADQITARRCGYNYPASFPYGDTEGDGLPNGTPTIWVRNAAIVMLDNIVVTDAGNDAIEATDCGNGVILSNIHARNVGGYIFDGGTTNSTTKHVHWDGPADRRNAALGAWRIPDGARVSGTAFGQATVDLTPGKGWWAAHPRKRANARIPLRSGVIVAAIAQNPGSVPMRAVEMVVEQAYNSSGGSRVAIARIDPVTLEYDMLNQSNSGSGSGAIFNAVGSKRQAHQTSGVTWPDLGEFYAFMAFQSGISVPELAAMMLDAGDYASWEPQPCAFLAGQTDIPASGTLIRQSVVSGVTVLDSNLVAAPTATLTTGLTVVGTNVPEGAIISRIVDASTLQLSETATGAGTVDLTCRLDLVPALGGVIAS